MFSNATITPFRNFSASNMNGINLLHHRQTTDLTLLPSRVIIDNRKGIKNLNFRGRKVHHFQAVLNDKKLEWNLQDNLTVLKASVTIFFKIIIQLGFSSNTYCWENLKENHVHLGNTEIWILINYVLKNFWMTLAWIKR